MNSAQSKLFKVQLWHLRRALRAERFVRITEKRLSHIGPGLTRGLDTLKDSLRHAKRTGRMHRSCVDAITPFVHTPLPLLCVLCALLFTGCLGPRPALPQLGGRTSAPSPLGERARGEVDSLLLPSLPSVKTPSLASPSVRPQYYLEWDWTPSGPIWFEVYHSTNLAGLTWSGGTNIPSGFTLFTNTPATRVPLDMGQSGSDFFIVRAVNSVGVSDWNQ